MIDHVCIYIYISQASNIMVLIIQYALLSKNNGKPWDHMMSTERPGVNSTLFLVPCKPLVTGMHISNIHYFLDP